MEKTKSGWWSVKFNITVEGCKKDFSELDDISVEHILNSIKEDYTNGELNTAEDKFGWWDVAFDITLEQSEIQFSELVEQTQEYILTQIRNDFYSGELLIEID